MNRICSFAVIWAIWFTIIHPVKANETMTTAWQNSIKLELNGNYTSAIEVLMPYRKKNFLNGAIQTRLGLLHYMNSQYNAAYRFYSLALRHNKQSMSAATGILPPLAAMGRWQEIDARTAKILKAHPANYQALLYRCLHAKYTKNWRKLLNTARSARAYHPTSIDFLIFQARALDLQGDINEAIDLFRQILVLFPANIEAINYLKTYAIDN